MQLNNVSNVRGACRECAITYISFENGGIFSTIKISNLSNTLISNTTTFPEEQEKQSIVY